jgi:hypothetical protein
MNDFFAMIYELFLGLYGQNLGYYLFGFDCDFAVVNQSGYAFVGFWLIGISIAVAALFYYAINSPRFQRWYHWLIMLGVNATINFLVAFNLTNGDLGAGKIPECFITDPATQQTLIDNASCIGFGLANVIVSSLLFIIISFSIRWWSTNASTCPFPS